MNFMKHKMDSPYITKHNMKFLQGFNFLHCRINISSLMHSIRRQFYLNSTHCQDDRTTGPYRFPGRCVSLCNRVITACLQKK